MFDTIMGLPLHILVLHVVVVIGPLAAVLALAYAVKADWRERLAWPLMAAAVTTGLFGLVTGASGERLEHRVRASGASAAKLALVHDHAELGDLTEAVCFLFMVVVLVVVYFLLPAKGEPRYFGTKAAPLWVGVLVVASLGCLGAITVTGHSGAKASWSEIGSLPVSGSGE